MSFPPSQPLPDVTKASFYYCPPERKRSSEQGTEILRNKAIEKERESRSKEKWWLTKGDV